MIEFLVNPMHLPYEICSQLGVPGVVLYVLLNFVLASVLWPFILNSILYMFRQASIFNWGHGLILGLSATLDSCMIQLTILVTIVLIVYNWAFSYVKT